jgi:hypothetical protein
MNPSVETLRKRLESAKTRHQRAREAVSRAEYARKSKGQRIQSGAEMTARSRLGEAWRDVYTAETALKAAEGSAIKEGEYRDLALDADEPKCAVCGSNVEEAQGHSSKAWCSECGKLQPIREKRNVWGPTKAKDADYKEYASDGRVGSKQAECKCAGCGGLFGTLEGLGRHLAVKENVQCRKVYNRFIGRRVHEFKPFMAGSKRDQALCDVYLEFRSHPNHELAARDAADKAILQDCFDTQILQV